MAITSYQKLLLSLLLLWALVGCSATPVKPVENPPNNSLHRVEQATKPVVALVLGGGAARGFAHVGVIHALEQAGIQVDMVVGTSAGSVVGALYAGGIHGEQLLEIAKDLEREKVTDWMFPDRGVLRGERLQQLVNELLQDRPIESFEKLFAAVATDLESGQLMAFTSGNAGMAVRASSTFPGLVPPIEIGGREYVDGGLVSQVPVKVARALGATVVIAVDVSRQPLLRPELMSTLGVMQQSIIIMSKKIAEAEIGLADVVIHPDVGVIPIAGFEMREQAIAAGEQAGLAALPVIKRVVAQANRRMPQK